MTTTIQKVPRGAQPALWWMNQLWHKYGSADMYTRFVEGGMKLTTELKKEWKDVYMEGIGLVPMPEFLEWSASLEAPYNKLFRKRKDFIIYRDLTRYIIPITAPKFSEQFDEELEANIIKIAAKNASNKY